MPFDMLDLAPELLGSSTSYGQEPDLSLGSSPNVHPYQYMSSSQNMSPTMPGGHGVMPPPPPPPHPRSPLSQRQGLNGGPTPDVVAAASLLQNGAAGSHAHNNYPQGLDFGGFGEMGPMGLMGLGQHANRGGQSHSNEHHFSGNQAGQQNHPQQAPSSQSRFPKMDWGSDTNFNQPQGYVAHAASETLEAMSQGQIKLLGCLHVSHSAATTRPSSPTAGQKSPTKTQSRRASDFAVEVHDADAPPRKRRKSQGKEDGTSPSSAASASGPLTGSRRRRPTVDMGVSPNDEDARPMSNGSLEVTPRQRRRKSSSGKKPPRENLSEEQKRENHIRSEQKRRTIIKEGFAEISAMVPKLRGGGYSKSNMLIAAADWLEKLINSNTVLREELAKLGP